MGGGQIHPEFGGNGHFFYHGDLRTEKQDKK
jgi:hypothetical protein